MSKPRILYVYPDEEVRIRVIRDDSLPKKHIEWDYQVRPPETVFYVRSEGALALPDTGDTYKAYTYGRHGLDDTRMILQYPRKTEATA